MWHYLICHVYQIASVLIPKKHNTTYKIRLLQEMFTNDAVRSVMI